MAEVNFYLKKVNPSTGKSLIYLQYKYHKKRVVFTFKETIEPGNWNPKKQRVKSNSIVTNDGTHLVNDLLDNLQSVCINNYNKEKAKGIPLPSTLKKALIDFLNYNVIEDEKKSQSLSFFTLVDRFCTGEIKYRGREKSKSTLENYEAAKKHMQDFSKDESYPLNFDTVNLDFFYRYTSYLKRVKKLAHNTIAKDVSIIKVIMGEGVDLGATTNMQFKHKKFSMPEIEIDATYLTEQEILKIYKYDLSSCSRLEKVRDLFVFGCYIGLRYSDYSNVKPENIIDIEGELFIKMITQKTKALVIIPVNPIILEIFNKYQKNPNKLPANICSARFNLYIKEIVKLVGLTMKGRVATDPNKELWQLVSSHTARRSFATNYYLQGFPTNDLKKITGHVTDRSFEKYLKVSKLDSAKRLQQHIKKNWSKYLLTAV